MNILIGLITACLILLAFSFFEKKENLKLKRIDLFFVLYVLFCSYIHKPFQDIFEWIALSFLFYSVLDDLKTKSLNILIPILVTLFFFINTLNPYYLLISFLTFCIIYLFSSLTKENTIAIGDAYLFLPLSFLLGLDNILFALYLSFVLGGVFISLEILLSKQREREYAFGPYLVLSSLIIYCEFYPLFITLIASVLSVLSLPLVLFLTRKKE